MSVVLDSQHQGVQEDEKIAGIDCRQADLRAIVDLLEMLVRIAEYGRSDLKERNGTVD
jgi:hypothetical protein